MPNIFYINGSYIPEHEANIGITDLGLLRGYGVFDFFRAINGHVLFLNDHLERFQNSADSFGLSLPHSTAQLTTIIAEIVAQNQAPLLGIKLVLTGGYSPDGYSPTSANFMVIAKPFSFAEMPQGMQLMSLEHQRELPQVKSLNYMVPIFHLKQMKAMAAHDYLYHKHDQVSELSRSNIFIVKNKKVITPHNHILYGITRKHVIALASENFEVEQRAVSLHEVLTADEIFTTGSTKRIIGISKIDGKSIGNSSKITAELRKKFLEFEKSIS